MARKRPFLSQRTSMLGPDLGLQKIQKNKISNIRIIYDEKTPQTVFTPSGGNPGGVTPTPFITKIITQSGNELITQAGDNIIIN